MSRLLLSCDDYIYHHDNLYYFKNQEWADFYQRYLRVFDALRIVNRVVEEPNIKKERVLLGDKRIEIYPLPIFHGPFEYAKEYFAVGRAIKNSVFGCDAAILRLPSTVAQRVSKQILKSGIPYATEIVFDACDGADTSNNLLEKALWRIIDHKMREICYKADGVACVTENYLQRRYHSLKPNHFESYYSTLHLEKSFFTSPRLFPDKEILTIAHVDLQIGLHNRKGTDIIIQTVAKLKRERGCIVNLKLAGEDRDNSTDKILNYAKEKGVEGQVSCVGLLSRESLKTFLDNSDLFVLPTKAEGLPRVIIEAIARGLPVITTPVSGNPELIPKEYLVPFCDIDSLARKIYMLITNKAEYERASKHNYEHSLQYEGTLLQRRRDQFYRELKALVA